LRLAGHHAGKAAGARGGGAVAEGHAADPVQPVLDPPVPAQPAGQLGGAGAAKGQAGDRVGGDGAPAAAARRADAAGDLDRLGGVGEAQAGDGGDLQGADLDPPMAIVAGTVHGWDLPPRQPEELGVRGWLVGLDDQQVASAGVDQEGGVVALGVQRVGGDQRTGKVQAGQQRPELGDLVGRRRHLALGEHGPVVVVQRCQQVDLVA
jgi:hypothetical protein